MKLPKADIANYTMTMKTTGRTVEFRPYTVKEEKVLLVALESRDMDQIVSAIYNVVDACTYNKINSVDMPTFELEELFVNIRSKSVGEVVNLNIKCSECDTVNSTQFPVLSYTVSGTTEEKKIEIGNGIGFVLKYPSFDIAKHVKEDGAAAEKVILMCALCIDYVYDADSVYKAEDTTTEELVEFIESLSKEQFTKISNFLQEIPKIKNKIEFTCSKCSHVNFEEVEGLQNFFT